MKNYLLSNFWKNHTSETFLFYLLNKRNRPNSSKKNNLKMFKGNNVKVVEKVKTNFKILIQPKSNLLACRIMSVYRLSNYWQEK